MNFCKDCKHCKHNIFTFGLAFAECRRPQLDANLVSGKPNKSFCSVQRNYEHLCGAEGKFFEPKNKVKWFYKYW
jgi:hypothetical protein